MHLLKLLLFTTTALADNPCITINPLNGTVCWYNTIPIATATAAITKACSAITNCIPSPGLSINGTGTSANVIARVHIGEQCIFGDGSLTASKCVELYSTYVSGSCGGTVEKFPLGTAVFRCDNSTLSINWGG